MKLTVNQAVKELKWLRKAQREENSQAINKHYGNLANANVARIKMTDLIAENGYCHSCYEKKVSPLDNDEMNCGLCYSCYMNWENQYLTDGR